MDDRTPLENGSCLILNNTEYTIKELVGKGCSTIAYRAEYLDEVIPDCVHSVIIKEFFPYHKNNYIYRDDNGCIVFNEFAEEYFYSQLANFNYGNSFHISLQDEHADKTAVNINSYKANNTVYTLVSCHNGETLGELIKQNYYHNLTDITECILNILDALDDFHHNNFLHMDLSPDNILLLPLDKGRKESVRRVFLIDYNNVVRKSDFLESNSVAVSYKELYSSPEQKIRDYKNISFSSDLYSVCVIFYELLIGNKPDTMSITRNNRYFPGENAGVFKNIPITARLQAKHILAKGLKLSPSQRYQSVSELKADLSELLDRINLLGITHSSLWEASCEAYQSAIDASNYPCSDKVILHQNISVSGNVVDSAAVLPAYLLKKNIKHCILCGEKGMGKTTALYQMWKSSVDEYNPRAFVCFYIAFDDYDENVHEFIKSKILRSMKYDRSRTDYDTALICLEEILDQCPSLTLLLDLPDSSAIKYNKLYDEISRLLRYNGVQIIIASRRGIPAFEITHAEMLPLKESEVRKYLTGKNLANDRSLPAILMNPQMLSFFGSIGAPDVEMTEKSILSAYFYHITHSDSEFSVGRNDRAAADYTLAVLLPKIAHTIKSKGFLTMNEIFSLVSKSYSQLDSKWFTRAFPDYTDKAFLIKGAIDTDHKFFEYLINYIAVKKLALISPDMNGNYRFTSDEAREYFNLEYINKRPLFILSNFRTDYLHRSAIVFAAVCIIFIGITIFNGYNKASVFPSTQMEKNLVKAALNRMVYTTTVLDGQLEFENKALNAILDSFDDSTEDYITYSEWVEKSGADFGAHSVSLFSDQDNQKLIESLNIPDNTIALDNLEYLYSQSVRNKEEYKRLFASLDDYLSVESGHTYKEKKAAVDYLVDYLNNDIATVYYKLQQLLYPIPKDAKDYIIHNYLPYSASFSSLFISQSMGETDFDEKLFICDEIRTGIIYNLKGIGFNIESTKLSGPAPTQAVVLTPTPAAELTRADREKAVIKDFEGVLFVIDKRTDYLIKALEQVVEYVDAPTEENLELAKKVCADSILASASLDVTASNLSKDLVDGLPEIGIDYTDYMTPFHYQSYFLSQNISSLVTLYYLLEHSVEIPEILEVYARNSLDYEYANRKLEYLSINSTFLHISDENEAYFRDTVFPKYSAIDTGEVGWEAEDDMNNAKADSVFNVMETAVNNITSIDTNSLPFVSDYLMELKTELIAGGYEEAAVRATIDRINELAVTADELMSDE